MRYYLLPLLAITLFFASGCAYVSSFSSDLPNKIDHLAKKQQYGEALAILDFIKPTHPQYAELKRREKRIAQLGEQFATNEIARAKVCEKKEQWQQAQHIYQTTLDKIPQHSGLNQAYETFLAHRNTRLQRLEQALILNRAQWLIDNTPVQKEFSHILANAEQRYSELKDFHRQVEDTSEKLQRCIEVNMKQGNNKIVARCLALVDKLAPGKIDKALRSKTQVYLGKAKLVQQKQQGVLTRTLIAQLKQGYSHENLLHARQQLDRLKGKKNLSRKTARLNAELKRRYDSGIEQGIVAGRKLYSDGKISEAVQVWNSLLAIDSENHKLVSHIKRAKRVLKKLETLSSEANINLKKPATRN